MLVCLVLSVHMYILLKQIHPAQELGQNPSLFCLGFLVCGGELSSSTKHFRSYCSSLSFVRPPSCMCILDKSHTVFTQLTFFMLIMCHLEQILGEKRKKICRQFQLSFKNQFFNEDKNFTIGFIFFISAHILKEFLQSGIHLYT